MKKYSEAQLLAAAKALREQPSHPLAPFVVDYGQVRDQIRNCRGLK